MTKDLISEIINYLSPNTMNQIADALGSDRGSVQTAIKGVIPALMAKFAEMSSRPGGAQKLFGAVEQADTGDPDSWMDSIKQQINRPDIVSTGTSMLQSLLGGGVEDLKSAISRFSGLSLGNIGKIMGLVTPLIMGVLNRELRTQGLDATGLSNLLRRQSGNISAAMPAELARMAGVGNTAGASARTTSYQPQTPRPTSAPSSNTWYWAVPLAVLALGAGLYYLYDREPEQVAEVDRPAPTAAPQGTTTPNVITAAAPGEIKSSLERLSNSLGNIRDAASAQTALPELQGIAQQFERAAQAIGTMTTEQKKELSNLLSTQMPKLNEQIERVLTMPGIEKDVEPAIKSLRAEMDSLSAASRA